MKRILIILISAFLPLAGYAQTQSLEFYYIAHDRTTPVADLCDRLEEVYETADRYEDYAVIFYLPNYDEPIIVKMNLPGDNRSDFKNIISELRLKPSHEIYADVDYAAIADLMNKHDFIDEKEQPVYSSVLFCWYVNPDFWQFLYNEELIASLYFNLELDKYVGYVTTQIWHASGDGLKVDSEYPFGTKNLCKGMNFMLYQY
ncbi:MAG: hypothetical protein IJN02_01090 [Bacteroidales bacterium]|nr:hypothetical protein [Bacteroidales bacterium]MBQ6687809.1 hypothetical protein [Bacteroidales bacterium]